MADGISKQVDFDKQVDIEALISAPLVAASKANVVMVTGQTRFLLDNCFTKKGDNYEPVMINMVMRRGTLEEERNEARLNDSDPEYVKKVRTTELTFSVPLLCLVSFNSLAINKVDLEFDMEITAAASWTYNEEDLTGAKNITKQGVKLSGKISYDNNKHANDNGKSQYKSTMSSKLKVNVAAGPLPLPVGLLSIIDLYSRAIQPLPAADKTNVIKA